MPDRALARRQHRARYARTNEPGGLRVNAPAGAGIPSGQDPSEIIWWEGSDVPFIARPGGFSAMAAVSRATSLIVNTITAAPWRRLAGSPDPLLGLIELPAPRWLSDPALFRADDRFQASGSATPAAVRQPRGTFWAQWLRSCLWFGVGYLIFEESADGAPVPGTMRVIHPDYVAPVGGSIGDGPIRRRIGSPDGLYVETGADGRLSIGGIAYRLMEITNPLAQVDEFGLAPGVLSWHAEELELAQRAIRYSAGTLSSGVPAGYLRSLAPTFTKPQAEQLRRDWMAAHGGDARSVAVLNSSTEFVPISISPIDLALIEQRKMSLLDVANAFGVPAYMLGGGDSGGLTYSNAESRGIDFRAYTLLPWARAIEDTLSSLMVTNEWVEVDFRGLLRSDTPTRYAAYQTALNSGFMTVDEIRRLEGLPPLPESVVPVPNARPAQEVPNGAPA